MKGYALAAVLFMIGLGGALAAGGAFVARRQMSDQRAISRTGTLDGLAEEWLARTIAEWDSAAAPDLGATVVLSAVATPSGTVHRWMTRTDTLVYWVVVEVASEHKPLLKRRLGAATIVEENRLLLAPGWGWSDLP